MGRSQVERNRIKGRPGSKGGRGRGAGGHRGGNNSNNKRKSGPDPRTLGDNAFRYERNRQKDNNNRNVIVDNDALLDDYHTELLLGSEYYGASHYDLQEDEYYNDTSNNNCNSDVDWMAVDIQALTTCFQQLPIHERLDIPIHVGKEIERRYGVENTDTGSGNRKKKTLAELREESKCCTPIIESTGEVTSKMENSNQDVSTIGESNNDNQDSLDMKESKNDDGENNDNDEDDLDAWLDDMIS